MFSKLKSNTTLCFAESSPASISASQGLPGRKEPIPLCVAWPRPHGIKKRTVEILQELNLNLLRKEPIYMYYPYGWGRTTSDKHACLHWSCDTHTPTRPALSGIGIIFGYRYVSVLIFSRESVLVLVSGYQWHTSCQFSSTFISECGTPSWGPQLAQSHESRVSCWLKKYHQEKKLVISIRWKFDPLGPVKKHFKLSFVSFFLPVFVST